MSDSAVLPRSVRRVATELDGLGVAGKPTALADSARTAVEAARGLGVLVDQIASSLLFMADGRPVLVVSSGGHRVDTTQLAAVLEAAEIRMATAAEVREHTGFAIGGVAPIGHPSAIRTVVDIALAAHREVWAAAGHHRYVFPTHYDELLRITAGTAAEVG